MGLPIETFEATKRQAPLFGDYDGDPGSLGILYDAPIAKERPTDRDYELAREQAKVFVESTMEDLM
jgi:hypothetical protein